MSSTLKRIKLHEDSEMPKLLWNPYVNSDRFLKSAFFVAKSFKIFKALLEFVDLRDDGVERVAHLVADRRVHDAHVLPLHVQELALDASGDVLNLHHGLDLVTLLLNLDKFYLEEGHLRQA